MRRITSLALLALAIAGCSHDRQPPAAAAGPVAQQALQVQDPRKVVSFDYGAYDSLIALGVGERVVATPGRLPPYLAAVPLKPGNAGGMKTPDLAGLRALQPDLILVTGRQADSREQLDAIAPTLDMGIADADYLAGVVRNVTRLGELFDRSSEADRALAALQRKAAQARQRIVASGKRTLVLTHNDGRFSPTEQPVIHSLLQARRALPAPPPMAAGTPRQRPQPLSAQAIAAASPEVIFIIDRSAAIGNAPLDVATLVDSPLADTPAARAQRIVYLDPPLWYLSGGGLQSLALQIDQVLAAYAETSPAR